MELLYLTLQATGAIANLEPITHSGLEVTKSISDYGLMVVTAAFFVITSMLQMWSNNKRYDKILKQNEDRYEMLFKKYLEGSSTVELVEKTSTLIGVANDLIVPLERLLQATTEVAKEECTYQQMARTLKVELRVAKNNLIESIETLNSSKTKEDEALNTKVQRVVVNQISDLRNNLNLYRYKGMQIGELIGTSWNFPLSDLIYNYLISESKKPSGIQNEMDIQFSEIMNYLVEKLGVSK